MHCRHTSTRSAKFKAKKSYPKVDAAFTSFRKFLNNLEPTEDIRDKKHAKSLNPILGKLRNVLSLYAPAIKWGPLERRRNISRLYAFGQFFGTASTF